MMHAQPSRPPYLFFSPKCPHCQQLIEMIKRNQSLARKIEPINVHTAKSLPPQLDGVPAILFGGQLLVGPDTFKWVQFQTPQQNKRDEGQTTPGMPNGIQGRQFQKQEQDGIPMPSDISSDTKHGIEFTHLSGQDIPKNDITLPRFSYLPGEGTQSNGTDGIDYIAAMDVNSMKNNKSEDVANQLERLQQMRGNDSERMREQTGQGMGGMGGQQAPGFSGSMGIPMGGISSQMQMEQSGYQNVPNQMRGYNQGMGQSVYIQPGMPQQAYDQQFPQQIQTGMGIQQNPYELQAGSRGGYSTQYQQQNNPYKNDNDLPKRF
jgi:hypothetical protein